MPEVPGSVDQSEWTRIWDPVGANTSSFGFDRPSPATQMPDPCPLVAHRRRRLHRDKHKGYRQRARPVQYPEASKFRPAAAERGLHHHEHADQEQIGEIVAPKLLTQIVGDLPEFGQFLPDKGNRAQYLERQQQQIGGELLLRVFGFHPADGIRPIGASLSQVRERF